MLIAIGHKARSGKDSTAKFLKTHFPNVEIRHWADSLYKEVAFNRANPLLIREGTSIWIRDSFYTNTKYDIKDVPFFNDYLDNNKTNIYYGMQIKDPVILQLWGTDFRRNMFGHGYWIKQIEPYLDNCKDIVIPDTRYLNELEAVKKKGGYYWKVNRWEVAKGGRKNLYIDPNRDPSHISENELNDYEPDFTLNAISGMPIFLKEPAIKEYKRLKQL